MTQLATITSTDLRRVIDSINGLEEAGGPSGHDGNIIKIWADLQPSLQGEPYCAGGVCYIWKHAGRPFPAIDHPWGYSYCPDAVHWAQQHGLWDASGHYEFGDTNFWCFDGTGVAGHTEIVIDDSKPPGIYDFGCNTSPDSGGSQDNGGGCYYRHREHGPMLLGVLKSSRWLADHPHHRPHPDIPSIRHRNPYTLNPADLPLQAGSRGDSVKWLEWALRIPVDKGPGVFGAQCTAAVNQYKRVHGLTPNGRVGRRAGALLLHR